MMIEHATRKDHGHCRGLGGVDRCGRGPVRLECPELYGLSGVDHDITLHRGSRVRQLRIGSRP